MEIANFAHVHVLVPLCGKRTSGNVLLLMSHREKTIGILSGIVAAVCYGTNPLGALKLYAEGMTTGGVLFYRFGLAWVIMLVVMLLRGERLWVSWRELRTLLGLGLLFIASSVSLYLSFHYMEAGVASTILFVYPVITAVIMAVLFHERMTLAVVAALVLSLAGVVLLYVNGGGVTLSTTGVLLVLLSAVTYAVYIIVVDRSPLPMSSFKINLYVLMVCALGVLLFSMATGQAITLPRTASSWFYVGWLAVVPGIMALCLMVYAAKYVGSTSTAVLGALEPLTAVLIGIVVFGESFSARIATGILLILSSVVIVALRKQPERTEII